MKKILFYMLLLVAASQCKKKDELPAPTQTGANTFGCYVNGGRWVPNGIHEIFTNIPGIDVAYADPMGKPGQHRNLFFWLLMSNHDAIQIYVRNCTHPGKYLLNRNTGYQFATIFPENYGLYSNHELGDFVTDTIHNGYINFTIVDTINLKVAGTFSFNAFSKNSNKSVAITDGRFDNDILKLHGY